MNIFPIESFNVSVSEEVPAGSQFARIAAIDADSGSFGEVVYSIIEASVVCLSFVTSTLPESYIILKHRY